jgi:ankyrin repeat protein
MELDGDDSLIQDKNLDLTTYINIDNNINLIQTNTLDLTTYINIKDIISHTFFYNTIINNEYDKEKSELTEYLLFNNFIDINYKTNEGVTPFYIACYANNLKFVEYLLSFDNIDINIPMIDGFTPLMCVCSNGLVDILKLILKYKKNDLHINNQNKLGHTALILTCKYTCSNIISCLNIIKLLIQHFPDLKKNIKDSTGKTALNYIIEYKNNSIIKKEYYEYDYSFISCIINFMILNDCI